MNDSEFKSIFNVRKLHLPIRWDGQDFLNSLSSLLDFYRERLSHFNSISLSIRDVEDVCKKIKEAVSDYLNGFPAQSYQTFCQVMEILGREPLKIYQKTSNELHGYSDPLQLFRVVRVYDNALYKRSRVFHTPYNLRSKVSTSRYSIAGFPSLYLGTSLKLCCQEVNYNSSENFAIASMFKMERDYARTHINIQVIELAVKPQDFLVKRNDTDDNSVRRGRYINPEILRRGAIHSAYLLWYPLIAACSFIRTNKNDPFAAEYIVPQLLMQWVRQKMCPYKVDEEELMGIRYFSCASESASDMGFNYVFPSSGQSSKDKKFCPVLAKAFKLTKPHYLRDYESIEECETALIKDTTYSDVFH